MIRAASPNNNPAIRSVISHAFGQTEDADLVEQLRADCDVLVELVEASDIAVQGHILYSPLKIEGPDYTINAAALAPVSVLKAFQKSGIGSALIRAGNALCGELGLEAVVILGHESYYPKFGFSSALAESLEAPFSGPHFMALELKLGALRSGGRVRYAKAFGV